MVMAGLGAEGVRRLPLKRAGGGGIDLRKEIGALDPVLGPGPLDVEDGDAQVAVVLQRQGDQLAQLRIDEELLPGDVGHRLCAGLPASVL